MTLEQLEKIPEEEWKLAASRLLQLLKRRYDEKACLPQGNSIEDVVYGAIADLIAGKRKYYIDQDLFWNLYWIARSNLNKLFRSADLGKRSTTIATDDENEEIVTPEKYCELPIVIDEVSFRQELEKEIAGDEDLGFVLISIFDDGATTPKEIADDTGLPIKRVYELKRKFGDKAKKVQQKLLKNVKSQVNK